MWTPGGSLRSRPLESAGRPFGSGRGARAKALINIDRGALLRFRRPGYSPRVENTKNIDPAGQSRTPLCSIAEWSK
jgi:hypothetical protein